MIGTRRQILFECANQGEFDGWGMWYVGGERYTGFGLGNLNTPLGKPRQG